MFRSKITILIVVLLITLSCQNSKINNETNKFPDKLSIIYKNRNPEIPYRIVDFLNDEYNFNYYTDKAAVENEILTKFSPISIDSLQYKFNEGINLNKKESIALSLLAVKYNKADDKKSKLLYKAMNEKRYEEAIIIAKDVLKKSPFSLQAIFSLYLACDNTKKASAVYANKFNYLCKAFQKMGGTSKENPICMTDKYSIGYYIEYYAIGSNSQLEKKAEDHLGNSLFIYKNMLGKEYFICPSK